MDDTLTARSHGWLMGFTLTELLVVLTLVVLMLSLAGPAAIDWGRTAKLRSSASAIAASLLRAQSEARALGVPVVWFATNDSMRGTWSYALLRGEERALIGATNYLSRGLWLGYGDGLEVAFGPDGGVVGEDLAVPLWECARAERGLVVTVMVSRVTGHVRVVQR
jgi:prepilin-type N-terminal cleavage/methylation domain-containing protein